jgi:glycosyltransferase involved in cell wall biosynthesis
VTLTRVDLVDPPAYSLPYDDALARALVAQGASVRVVTSEFAYGPAPSPDGYELQRRFYRGAHGAPGSRLRQATKVASHMPDMLRYVRSTSAQADVVHFQWLTVPELDLRLLPAHRPVALTIHDPLQRERGGPDLRPRLHRSAFARVDAVVVHSEYARAAVVEAYGLEPSRVHVIRHGALGELPTPGALPAELEPQQPGAAQRSDPEAPVVLCFGLVRPYKGLETLLSAWRGVTGAELWIVGRPMMDLSATIAVAPSGVRFVPRFVSAAEEAAVFARADVVVLPYERSERFGFSGVLATALGLGKALVLSDVGGFAEVGDLGAARMVPPSDADGLRAALIALIGDPNERRRLAAAALDAARGPFSWETAARATLELYGKISP